MRVWTLDWLDDAERVKNEIKVMIDSIEVKSETVKPIVKPAYAKIEFEKMEETEFTKYSSELYTSAVITMQGTSDDYYLEESFDKIGMVASTLIEKEAPISKKLLMRKVLNAWGISRGGSRVEGIFSSALARIDKIITKDEDRVFFWKKDQVPEHYEIYRVEDANGNKRSMDDIPSKEILNAIVEVLKEQVSLSEMDLLRETAKKFGFSRLGNVIETSVKYAIFVGINEGNLVRLDNGNIVLSE